MRFGQDERLHHGKVSVKWPGGELRDQMSDADELALCAAVAAVPTITPVGMAALLPDLDKPGPESMREYAPTVASVLMLLGSHWLMHAGQFVPIRRKLGKPPLF